MQEPKRHLKPVSSEFLSLLQKHNTKYSVCLSSSSKNGANTTGNRKTLEERKRRYPEISSDVGSSLMRSSATAITQQRTTANIRKVPSQPIICIPKPKKIRPRSKPRVASTIIITNLSDVSSTILANINQNEQQAEIERDNTVELVTTNNSKRSEDKSNRNSKENQGKMSAFQHCYCFFTKKKKKKGVNTKELCENNTSELQLTCVDKNKIIECIVSTSQPLIEKDQRTQSCGCCKTNSKLHINERKCEPKTKQNRCDCAKENSRLQKLISKTKTKGKFEKKSMIESGIENGCCCEHEQMKNDSINTSPDCCCAQDPVKYSRNKKWKSDNKSMQQLGSKTDRRKCLCEENETESNEESDSQSECECTDVTAANTKKYSTKSKLKSKIHNKIAAENEKIRKKLNTDCVVKPMTLGQCRAEAKARQLAKKLKKQEHDDEESDSGCDTEPNTRSKSKSKKRGICSCEMVKDDMEESDRENICKSQYSKNTKAKNKLKKLGKCYCEDENDMGEYDEENICQSQNSKAKTKTKKNGKCCCENENDMEESDEENICQSQNSKNSKAKNKSKKKEKCSCESEESDDDKNYHEQCIKTSKSKNNSKTKKKCCCESEESDEDEDCHVKYSITSKSNHKSKREKCCCKVEEDADMEKCVEKKCAVRNKKSQNRSKNKRSKSKSKCCCEG